MKRTRLVPISSAEYLSVTMEKCRPMAMQISYLKTIINGLFAVDFALVFSKGLVDILEPVVYTAKAKLNVFSQMTNDNLHYGNWPNTPLLFSPRV